MKAVFTQAIKREYHVAVLVFLTTTLLFFRPQLLGKAYFWEDFTEQVFPNRVYAAKTLQTDEFPHWNPYSFCGMPFQADVQTALYYPPHIVFDRVIAANTKQFVYWLQLLIIAHFLLAQLTMYALVRHFGFSSTAGIISAVSYAFSAPLALHTHHPMFIEHLAWLPLLVLFIHRTITTRSLSSIGWGALIGGMMLLSGSPQMSLYCLTFCALLAMWWSLTVHNAWKVRLASLAKSVAVVLLSVGIYSIQYIPSSELAQQSERATLSYEQATEGSLEWKQLVTAIVPKTFGIVLPPDQSNQMPYFGDKRSYLYWDTAFYFGISALLLAMWTVIQRWKGDHHLVQPLTVLSALAVFFALGSNSPIYPIVYKLPFFGQLRIPARMMFVGTFSVALLAGCGWDEMLRMRDRKSLYVLVASTLIIATIVLIVTAALDSSAFNPPTERIKSAVQNSAWTQMVLLIATVIVLMIRRKGIRTVWLSIALTTVIFVDLYSAHGAFSASRINPADEYARAFPLELKAVLLPRPPDTIFRVSMRQPGMIAMKRNQGLVDGVMLFEGYNQLLLKRRHPAVTSPELVSDLLAVRWSVRRDSLGQWRFLPRETAFPMAWLVYAAHVVQPESVAETMRNNTTIDYHYEAIIEQELPFALGTPNASDTVYCIGYTPSHLTYRVRCAAPALLVLSEVYYPAWRAYVDGSPTNLLRANYCLRAVAVPAGEHTIELRFESSTFALGSLITAAALACAFATLMIGGVRQIQHRHQKA